MTALIVGTVVVGLLLLGFIGVQLFRLWRMGPYPKPPAPDDVAHLEGGKPR